VEAALRAGLEPVKINVVMMSGILPEVPSFVAITKDRPLHVRFIEWDAGGGVRSTFSGRHTAEGQSDGGTRRAWSQRAR
jgi:cyclic pyranopterin phosphate synthase